jgi:hypothetical protein
MQWIGQSRIGNYYSPPQRLSKVPAGTTGAAPAIMLAGCAALPDCGAG